MSQWYISTCAEQDSLLRVILRTKSTLLWAERLDSQSDVYKPWGQRTCVATASSGFPLRKEKPQNHSYSCFQLKSGPGSIQQVPSFSKSHGTKTWSWRKGMLKEPSCFVCSHRQSRRIKWFLSSVSGTIHSLLTPSLEGFTCPLHQETYKHSLLICRVQWTLTEESP
jgi:hypothetical protein